MCINYEFTFSCIESYISKKNFSCVYINLLQQQKNNHGNFKERKNQVHRCVKKYLCHWKRIRSQRYFQISLVLSLKEGETTSPSPSLLYLVLLCVLSAPTLCVTLNLATVAF